MGSGLSDALVDQPVERITRKTTSRSDSFTLEKTDRLDDLICSHTGAGGGGNIDVETLCASLDQSNLAVASLTIPHARSRQSALIISRL